MNTPDCRVIELRQYRLHPGRRDDLIELFEREFVDTQEALGLRVLGIFRDADDPDRFVWLRGFADMAARGRGLPAFYGGPVWKAHREAANATMIDSDDVLLLRPVTPWPAPTPGDADAPAWQAQVFRLAAAADAGALADMRDSGQLWLTTEAAANNFPPLPVREGETVAVVLGRGRLHLPPTLAQRLGSPIQTLNLRPTPRSAMR